MDQLLSQDNIEIITACDENYVQHLGVMLCSLLENTSYTNIINIHVIDGGITLNSAHQLSTFIENTYNIKINYLSIDQSIFAKFPISHHLTHATYYRISIPLLLNNFLKKALYLDADMIVKDEIKKVWDFDISQYYAASVEVLDFEKECRYADLNMPEKSLYFCAGILLINLNKWREDNIVEKVIQFIEQNRDNIPMMDQDALNSILCNKWLPLSLKWNQLTYFFDTKIYEKFHTRQDFIESLECPSIIHYTSSYKPWHYGSNHPYTNEYFNYLKLTPWKDYKSKRNFTSLKRMIKGYLQKILNK